MHPYRLFLLQNLREFNNVVVFDKEETGFSKNTNAMGSLSDKNSLEIYAYMYKCLNMYKLKQLIAQH